MLLSWFLVSFFYVCVVVVFMVVCMDVGCGGRCIVVFGLILCR